MRKLASIRKVKELRAIAGADRIEVALIDGWQCVVKKDEFKVGDLGVYFEIDSFLLAEDSRFQFLSNHTNFQEKRGFRLRTIKLRGTLSQGLLLPLSAFPELHGLGEGEDVTEKLGVIKWEPPIPADLNGKVLGPFPEFIAKTDQERVQNIENLFELYRDLSFEVTVKVDGTSMTVYRNGDHLGVCSRNLELSPEDQSNSFWKVANRSLVAPLMELGRNIALQGELIGEGIQKNKERLKGQEFFLYDIYDIDQGRYLFPAERRALLSEIAALGHVVQHVPVLEEECYLSQRFSSLAELLQFANGPSLNPEKSREGIVFKVNTKSPAVLRSFKVISNEYLLAEK